MRIRRAIVRFVIRLLRVSFYEIPEPKGPYTLTTILRAHGTREAKYCASGLGDLEGLEHYFRAHRYALEKLLREEAR